MHATALVGRRLNPNGHWIPAAQECLGRGLLVNDDSVHHRFGTIAVGALQQQPVITSDRPGVERLHSPKVGDLDGGFAQFSSLVCAGVYGAIIPGDVVQKANITGTISPTRLLSRHQIDKLLRLSQIPAYGQCGNNNRSP
jgi:hypothetical protein